MPVLTKSFAPRLSFFMFGRLAAAAALAAVAAASADMEIAAEVVSEFISRRDFNMFRELK